MRSLFLLTLLTITSPAMAQDSFVQGPERVNEVRKVAGTVIGVHQNLERTCAVVLANQAQVPAAVGLGGGGRFFVCSSSIAFKMGHPWKGQVKQTDTRLARVGPRWRVLPVFELVR